MGELICFPNWQVEFQFVSVLLLGVNIGICLSKIFSEQAERK